MAHDTQELINEKLNEAHHDSTSDKSGKPGTASGSGQRADGGAADEPQAVDISAMNDLFREALTGRGASDSSPSVAAHEGGTGDAPASGTGQHSLRREDVDVEVSEVSKAVAGVGTAATEAGAAAVVSTRELAADLARAAEGLAGGSGGSGDDGSTSSGATVRIAMACTAGLQRPF
jgi:hypothetical protein